MFFCPLRNCAPNQVMPARYTRMTARSRYRMKANSRIPKVGDGDAGRTVSSGRGSEPDGYRDATPGKRDSIESRTDCSYPMADYPTLDSCGVISSAMIWGSD